MAKNAPLARKFQKMLDALGFDKPLDNVRKKTISKYTLSVDFNQERIDYGKDIRRDDETTCNFSHAENLVVLECVHRLLEKGYEPKHLTLEPKWQVGRGSSGGKADILVRGKDGKTMLIIECKTWGAEFDKEQKRMRAGGGQLLSYLQQDKNAKYLCLYASDVGDDTIKHRNAIVKIQDREEDIKARRKDDSVKLYRDANTAKELHEVWKERFNLYFHYNGIFEDDVNAYEIELKPLKKKDLLPFSESEGMFNQFAEILRHNNISDNANAFNRVLSLLLCKMVDEEKGDNEVLDFQVKEGEDTPEKIHDRLQNLYQTGMKKYLLEDVVYHSDSEITDIIKKYPDQTPLEKIRDIFREIKYYTNNEFAFKEVHNKELFEQNSRVLNEVIKMLQNHRFKYTKKQQILGDFFELMLNHGVKQSEGQFFTPVPLVRFVLLSIGLERVIEQKLASGEERFLPKILDYACGAGHFLTESIDELQKYLVNMPEKVNGGKSVTRAINKTRKRYRESTEWAKDYIFGVEKDYRLARTSQIACFINGDGEANIIFGDGLKSHQLLRDAGKFDLIVANPPYSVKAFKNYLRVSEDDYALFKHLNENSGEIQVLFLERAAQLLAVGGVAGIIMPSTILANSGIDAKARKLMLEKFEIKALAEFGGKTFTATGTNTVILFLRRRSDNFAKDRNYIARDLFAKTPRPRRRDFIDSHKLLADFAEKKRGLSVKEYQTLINRAPSPAVRKTDWFANYRAAESGGKTEKEFLDAVLELEKNKFYSYMLCLGEEYDSQRLVAVTSGNTTDEQKQFLGYEHSSRRGMEGIKVTRDAAGKYDGKMYDDDNRANPRRASSYILANIWGDDNPANVDDTLKNHVRHVLLADCLNFDSAPFDAAINVKTAGAAPRQWFGGKHPMTRLKDIPGVAIKKGDAITKSKTQKGDIPVVAGGATPAYYHNRANRTGKTVTISASGSAGFVNFYDRDIFASDCITVQSNDKSGDDIAYIHLCLKASQEQIYDLARGQIQPHVYVKDMENFQIPLPPPNILRKIAGECKEIDRRVNDLRQKSARLRAEIDGIINVKTRGTVANLAVLSKGQTNPSKTPDDVFHHIGLEHIERDTGELLEYEEVPGRELKSSKNLFQKGDVLYGKMRPYLNKVHVAEFDGICSSEILALQTSTPLLVKYALLSESFVTAANKATTGMNRPRLSPAKFMDSPIPLIPAKAREAAEAKILEKDRRIKELNAEIAKAQERKIAMLKKHLQ